METYNHRLSLYYKISDNPKYPFLIDFLSKSAKEDLIDTIIIILYTRDCRGGRGKRDISRDALQWLMVSYPNEFSKIISLISEYGRWDDLFFLFPGCVKLDSIDQVNQNFKTNLTSYKDLKIIIQTQKNVVKFYSKQLEHDFNRMKKYERCSLSSKWAPTEDGSLDTKYDLVSSLVECMDITRRQYRKEYIVPLRTYLKIPEGKMSKNEWDELEYSNLPKNTVKKNTKAFLRHDSKRFRQWNLNKKNKKFVENEDLSIYDLISYYNIPIINAVSNEINYEIERCLHKITDSIQSEKTFDNFICVVNTGGSMYSRFIENKYIYDKFNINVAISLGILVNNSSEFPSISTFSPKPKLLNIPSNTSFLKLVQNFLRLESEYTFDLIELCKEIRKYKRKIDGILVITNQKADYNIDKISDWEKANDIEHPCLYHWNLDNIDIKYTKISSKIYEISGFSKDIFQSILKTGKFSNITNLKEILNSPRYQPIKDAFV